MHLKYFPSGEHGDLGCLGIVFLVDCCKHLLAFKKKKNAPVFAVRVFNATLIRGHRAGFQIVCHALQQLVAQWKPLQITRIFLRLQIQLLRFQLWPPQNFKSPQFHRYFTISDWSLGYVDRITPRASGSSVAFRKETRQTHLLAGMTWSCPTNKVRASDAIRTQMANPA